MRTLILESKELVFGEDPSQLEVLEELIHLGQLRKRGFPESIARVEANMLDIEAKRKIRSLRGIELSPHELEELDYGTKYHEFNLFRLQNGLDELSLEEYADHLRELGYGR